MVLKEAVKASPRLTEAVKPGKQALENADRSRISLSGVALTDSLALDREFERDKANLPRWDYLLGIQAARSACVLGMEVHKATPGEVKAVIAKKNEALRTLSEEGVSDIVREWIWVASGKVKLPPTTSEYRQLLKAGISLVRHLEVKGCPGPNKG